MCACTAINTMVVLLDRIQLDGEFGTVKYVGTLPAWGDEVIAYGIEWDNPERGKNDGSVGGVRYFSVEKPGSGSFVKASNKRLTVLVLFVDALIDTYAGVQNVEALKEEIVIGTKRIESLGFEKLNKQQAQLASLQSITLDKKSIGFCGPIERISLLLCVTYLDLSYNLLVDMKEVWKIVARMPQLATLNVNGNVIRNFETPVFDLVTSLQAASCDLNESSLQQLLESFPHLKKLCVAGNRLTLVNEKIKFPSSLVLLDLSFNSLREVPNVAVDELILANNQISTLGGPPVPTRALDLRENPIEDWNTVDYLMKKFSTLEELRIDGCKVFKDMPVDEMTALLIGRLRCLNIKKQGINKLNGSALLADEIRSAELYVLSEIRLGHLHLHNLERLAELETKYGPVHPVVSNAPQKHPNRIVLSVKTEEFTTLFSRIFLHTNTVLRLKGVVSKHTNVPVHRFKLYYRPQNLQILPDTPKTYLDDDVATLAGAGLENHDCVLYEPELS